MTSSGDLLRAVAGRGTPSRARNWALVTLGNELSEETHMLTKQEILLGQGTQVDSSRVREPRLAVSVLW